MLAVLEVDAVVCKNLICADARKRGAMNTKGLLRRASAFVFSTALALSLLAGSTPATQANAATKKNDTIVILHTNDIHAQTDQTVGEDGKVARIGFPAVAKYKKDMVKKYGKSNVTLLDAGDSMQGENVATVSKGLNIIKIMNKVGYDVAIPGNHEFDYSFDNMLKLVGSARAEYLCCNLTYLGTGDTVLKPYVIKNYGGTKVAYVGVDTPESFSKSTPEYFKDSKGNWAFSFAEGNDGKDLYASVQKNVNAARKAGAKYVVLIGHLGQTGTTEYWRSDAVVKNTTGIDVVIDGHSHEVYSQNVKNKKGKNVIITQTGTKLENLGKITINKKSGKIKAVTVKPTAEDAGVKKYVDGIKAGFSDQMSEKLASSKTILYTMNPDDAADRIIRERETNLGDLCADAFKTRMGSDIAIVNGGGIRVQVEKGDITLGTAYSVFPFNNTPVVIEVTGKQIKDFLEFSYRKVENDENGGFAHVAGLTCTVDATVSSSAVENDKGEFTGVKDGKYRVKDIIINGEALDLNKKYTVAGTNYTIEQCGDGNTAFKGYKEVKAGSASYNDADLFAEYLKKDLGGVIPEKYSNPLGEGRINIITK